MLNFIIYKIIQIHAQDNSAIYVNRTVNICDTIRHASNIILYQSCFEHSLHISLDIIIIISLDIHI